MKLPLKPAVKSLIKTAAPKPPVAVPTPPSCVYIGIDLSLRHTGVVVLDGAGKKLHVETFDNPAVAERSKLGDYNAVVCFLRALVLSYLKGADPIYVIREDYAYAAGSSSETILKELGGIIEWELNKIPTVRYSAVGVSSNKKWMTGSGNADKEAMMDAAYRLFQYEGNEHEADAYGVVSLFVETLRPGTFPQFPKAQLAVAASARDRAAPKDC